MKINSITVQCTPWYNLGKELFHSAMWQAECGCPLTLPSPKSFFCPEKKYKPMHDRLGAFSRCEGHHDKQLFQHEGQKFQEKSNNRAGKTENIRTEADIGGAHIHCIDMIKVVRRKETMR